MPSHTTLTEKIIDYPEPTSVEAEFLARVQAAVADPAKSEDDLVALVYGRQNPLLDNQDWPGHSIITREALKNPLFHLLGDLIDRKRLALGLYDIEAARACFSMTMQEAAEQLSLSLSEVHHAVNGGELASWRINGRVMVAPGLVDAYRLSRRELFGRLRVRVGNKPGLSLRFKRLEPFDEERSPEKHVVEGILSRWIRCAIAYGGEGFLHFVSIEPGAEENEIEHGPFYVRGRFRVRQRIDQAQAASDAFKEFKPL